MSHPNQRGGGEWIWTLAVNTFPGFHPRPQSRDQQDARLRRGQTELETNLGEVRSFHNILVESSYNLPVDYDLLTVFRRPFSIGS